MVATRNRPRADAAALEMSFPRRPSSLVHRRWRDWTRRDNRSPGALVACLLLGAGLVSVVGCSSSGDIDARDSESILPSGRITWDIIQPEARGLFAFISEPETSANGESAEGTVEKRASASRFDREVAASFAVDAELAYGGGESSQNFDVGEGFSMDGLDVVGPARVSHEYDLYHWSFTARGGFWVDEFYSLEGIAGLGFDYLDLEVSSGATTVSDRDLYVGPLIGAQFSVRPFSWSTVYARGTLTFGFAEELFSFGAAETGISLSLHERLSVFGGWRWWDLDVERDDESDVHVELSGPTFGLQLNL